MKSSTFVLALATTLPSVHGLAPSVPQTSNIYSGPSALVPREGSECSTIDELLKIATTGSMGLVYVAMGAGSFYSVCKILDNRGVEGLGNGNCGYAAYIVGSGILGIYAIVHHGQIGVVDNSPEEDKLRRRGIAGGSTKTLADLVGESFNTNGRPFDSIDYLPMASGDLGTRDASNSTARQMQHHFRINGIKYGNITHDMIVAGFGNGEGHVFVSPSVDPASNKLQKRHDGPGFKIAYVADMQTRASHADQIMLSQAVSQDWAYRADKNQNINNYMGFAASHPHQYLADL